MVFLYVVTVEEKLEKSPKKDSVGALEQRADEAIDASQFPEHEEALRTLRSSLELWLGLRERSLGY
ncbi:TPA: hypothetical protein ACV5N7_001331 [Pseudomonas aeruginosa]|jgi:hypothetical protein|nr:hypothetical protein IPC468_29185 [Pseudomonas aeruginosa]